jgi:hypothetical protein
MAGGFLAVTHKTRLSYAGGLRFSTENARGCVGGRGERRVAEVRSLTC